MNKQYTVRFAKTTAGKDGKEHLGHILLEGFKQYKSHFPAKEIAGYGSDQYQVRDLTKVGSNWQGVFGKLRDEAPHVVDKNNNETIIPLNAGERLLEKCHFIYKPLKNVLVWQMNTNSGSLNRFSIYLYELLETIININIVMNDADIQSILSRNVYELSFSYARPDSIYQGSPKWNKQTFDMLKDADAAHGKFLFRAARGGSLASSIINTIKSMLGTEGAEKIKVRLTDDMEPIELFLSPVKDKISVELTNGYPSARDVYVELESAYDRQKILMPSHD